jgi:hypothetical protein
VESALADTRGRETYVARQNVGTKSAVGGKRQRLFDDGVEGRKLDYQRHFW